MKKGKIKKENLPDPDRDTMRCEYDFSKARRGVTAARYAQGTNVVVLDPDVVRLFPNALAVNEALRAIGGIIQQAKRSKDSNLTPS